MSNSTQLQLRRGTAAECNAFTGAIGEVVVDTTNNQLRLHDGVTIGGHIIGGSGTDSGSGSTGDVTPGIPTVTDLPSTGSEGEMIIFDNVVYVYHNNEWITLRAFLTPDAPNGIEIVYTLPTSGTEGQIVFWSSNANGGNKLYKWSNGAWTAVAMAVDTTQQVADASITIAKFAQGITPIEIVNILPITGNFEGKVVFYTVDNKLYRYTGTVWTSALSASDITGTITSTQIGSNQIATGHLQANSITSSQLAASSVIAGKVAAGAISTTELAAGAVRADNLYAGAVTADKIAANAITATKIAAGAITAEKLAADALVAGTIQAGSIGATQIASGAITSDKLGANSVIAGKIAAGAITSDKIGVTDLSAINAQTGSLSISNSSGTGQILAGNAAVSGTTMLGAGAIIKQSGQFALGNTSTNITYNGTQLTLNGNIVGTSNVQDGAISSISTNTHSRVYGGGGNWDGDPGTLVFLIDCPILQTVANAKILVNYSARVGYISYPSTTYWYIYRVTSSGSTLLYDGLKSNQTNDFPSISIVDTTAPIGSISYHIYWSCSDTRVSVAFGTVSAILLKK